MCTCSICLDTLSSAIALPCGHVFCRACLVHAIQLTPACPTCRAALPLTAPDPTVVPNHLQPYVHPPLRRLYVDPPMPSTAPATVESTPDRVARLEADNALLRQAVARWRLFADAQLAAAARMHAYACAVRAEKDAVCKEYEALKRKCGVLGDDEAGRPAKRRAQENGDGRRQAMPCVLSTSGLIPADILSDSCPPLARRKRARA